MLFKDYYAVVFYGVEYSYFCRRVFYLFYRAAAEAGELSGMRCYDQAAIGCCARQVCEILAGI